MKYFTVGMIGACASICHSASAELTEWSTASGGNGHSYEAIYSTTRVTWEDARALATARGGYLATLTSELENSFVLSLAVNQNDLWSHNTYGGPWLGAYQPDPAAPAASGWAWVTGESWSYTNWALGEPGDQGFGGGRESYLQFVNLNGQWNDFTNDGNQTYSYIVEYTVPAPGVGACCLLALLKSRSRRSGPIASAVGRCQ